MGKSKKQQKNLIGAKYNDLLTRIKTDDFYKVDLTNRVNFYVCDCGYSYKTKDIDAGVTPMFHKCLKCDNLARSTMYTDINPEVKPLGEWYRPTLKWLLKNRDYDEHILNGGLIFRLYNED